MMQPTLFETLEPAPVCSGPALPSLESLTDTQIRAWLRSGAPGWEGVAATERGRTLLGEMGYFDELDYLRQVSWSRDKPAYKCGRLINAELQPVPQRNAPPHLVDNDVYLGYRRQRERVAAFRAEMEAEGLGHLLRRRKGDPSPAAPTPA